MSARKSTECGQKQVAPSNGGIYCCGPLLRAVQLVGLYKDSKYFVDMSCRYSPERILADYQMFSSCKKNETSMKHLTNFVDNHFDQPGTEMEYWSPPDWRCEPCFLKQIKDPQLKKFASDLNRIWKQLGRNMKDCVRTSPLMYSLIYVPNPLILPGGRYIEFYYWDTYWIVRGLLYSGMIQTARGMIDNLLYLVQMYKSVPCGGRIYYWGRSQPPLLTFMVKSYLEITKDEKYALRALPLLEIEMDNFMKSHSVEVQGRTMYQYRDKSSGPRPEFYREDLASSEGFACLDEKEEHFANLKAACESGMDFSSRWFVSPTGTNVGTLANIKTTWIVPVDLNCLVFRSCKTLAELNTLAGKTAQAQVHRTAACGLIKAISAVMWNEERGVWLDYDLKNKKQRDFFVVTNLSPLYFHAYPIADSEKISASVMEYIEENKLDTLPGGVPHTMSNTGQKWDYPNVWPPMMHMLIEGLNNLGTPEATEMSQRWRERWVRCNYEAYSKTGFMYEKYNCEESGRPGTGAEYPSQTGFGWTNGVIIELLAKYGNTLTASKNSCACQETDNQGTGLENCPITSEAYLEKKAKACDTVDAAEEAEDAGNKSECGCKSDVQSFATSEPPISVPCCPNVPEPPPCGTPAGNIKASSRASKDVTSQQRVVPCAQGNTGGTPSGKSGANSQRGQRSSQFAQVKPCDHQAPQAPAKNSPCGICGEQESQANADEMPCGPYFNAAPQQKPTQSSGAGTPRSERSGRNSKVQQAPAPAEPVSEMCSVCCGACKSGNQALNSSVPQPKPIPIEEVDIKCLLDLNPSEQDNALAPCPCDSRTETGMTQCEDESSHCEDSDDSSGGCTSAPPKPVMMNKIFPLADDIKCPLPKPVSESEVSCYCYQNKQQPQPSPPPKECD